MLDHRSTAARPTAQESKRKVHAVHNVEDDPAWGGFRADYIAAYDLFKSGKGPDPGNGDQYRRAREAGTISAPQSANVISFDPVGVIQRETGLDRDTALMLQQHRSGGRRLTWEQTHFCEALEERLANQKAERALGIAPRDDYARGPRDRAPATPSQTPREFKLIPFANVRLDPTPAYSVKGILPRTGLAVVWGPPKCGKSFWTFDLTMHVALGWEYRGHRVKGGPVVYLALEGGHGFAARVEAWRQRHLAADHDDPVPFYLVDVPVDLVADHATLVAAIKTQEQKPAVVVIDTLNRALIGDENKSDDMARFIRAADVIRAAFDCLVVVIHHCGVVGSRPRGHTSLAGADDVQIAIERNQEGTIVAKIEHMKDGDASAPMASRLEPVELGIDADGDPISSCVIVASELPVKLGGAAATLSGATKLAFDSLCEVLAESGEVPPASNHIPPDIRVVSAVLWREHFYKAYAGDKPDAKQKAFVRATLKLQEKKLVGLWSDKAWIATRGKY